MKPQDSLIHTSDAFHDIQTSVSAKEMNVTRDVKHHDDDDDDVQ